MSVSTVQYTGEYISSTFCFNPIPHGSGRIYPHLLRRPVAGEGLKWKICENSDIPRKMSCEEIPLSMYPPAGLRTEFRSEKIPRNSHGNGFRYSAEESVRLNKLN